MTLGCCAADPPWHSRPAALESEQLLKLLSVKADHELLTPYDSGRRSHHPHTL